jgi:hypothetical protein
MDYRLTDLTSVLAVFHHHGELIRGCAHKSGGHIHVIAFEFLRSYSSRLSAAPLQLLKHLIKFQERNSPRAFDIFGMLTDDIVGLSANFMAKYSDECSAAATEAAKLWSLSWH